MILQIPSRGKNEVKLLLKEKKIQKRFLLRKILKIFALVESGDKL